MRLAPKRLPSRIHDTGSLERPRAAPFDPCTTRRHPQFPTRLVREPRTSCTSLRNVHHASYGCLTPGAPRPRACNALRSQLTIDRHHLEADDERRTDLIRRTRTRHSENNITDKHLRSHHPDTGEVCTYPGNVRTVQY